MDIDDFQAEFRAILHPEPDEDGIPPKEYPHQRLKDVHALDFAYMDSWLWEGASNHPYTRLCPEDEDRIRVLTRNSDVPTRLLESAFQTIVDSVVAYHGKEARNGQLRYYPPAILTFWSGFETFVRHSTELMLVTVLGVPDEVADFLRELEPWVDCRGEVCIRSRFRPVLDRYAVFLKHAYRHDIDRGSRFWQRLEEAKDLRDYYTHLDVNTPRAISVKEVLEFMEDVLLGIIWPCSILQRTLLLGVYDLYEVWVLLHENAEGYTEQPFFFDWNLQGQNLFHCNFEGVDADCFPNLIERQEAKKEPEKET